jgi:hypothetical protein
MSHTKVYGACIATLGLVSHHAGSAIPADAHLQDTQRLVVDCPHCGRSVPYPGRIEGGEQALAECVPCDVYFDCDSGLVRRLESIGCGPALEHLAQQTAQRP